MSQLIYDDLTGMYIRLAPHNKLPDAEVVNCPIIWFTSNGRGGYDHKQVEGQSFQGRVVSDLYRIKNIRKKNERVGVE